MFTKIMIALTTVLVVGTTYASAAPRRHVPAAAQNVQSHADFERNWFNLATGRQDTSGE